MASTQALVTSFKVGLLDGEFDFSSDTSQVFKIALFTSDATLDATTTVYSATNESTGTGYTAGGATLTIAANPAATDTTAFLDFADVTWSSSSTTARVALIYKADGVTDPAIAVVDLGAERTTSNADFVVQFPAGNSTQAIVRII